MTDSGRLAGRCLMPLPVQRIAAGTATQARYQTFAYGLVWTLRRCTALATTGGLDAITRSPAIEYAKDGIRVNAVAPGAVDTPLHKNNPKEFLKTLAPMGSVSTVQEIVDAVMYLTEAPHVTGEVLHVDGGAHIGKW